MSIPPILCVSGPAGRKRAALLDRLVPALSAGGLKVAIIRQARAEPAAASPDHESLSLAAVGAEASISIRPDGLIMHGHVALPLLDLASMVGPGCDLVLAEGFERSPVDKIPVLPADEPFAVAAWVHAWLERRRRLGMGVMGALLVGGKSRRMGSDKAAMRVRGQAVLPRLAELLGGRLGEVWGIGASARGVELPRCVGRHRDLRPGCGPLGGIATALRIAASGAESPRAVLAVACDMPSLGGRVLDLLLENRRPDRPATVLRNGVTGRLEPLAAIYEPRAAGPIEKALDAGAFSITALLESIDAPVVDVPAELAGQLANVNTPRELREIEQDK